MASTRSSRLRRVSCGPRPPAPPDVPKRPNGALMGRARRVPASATPPKTAPRQLTVELVRQLRGRRVMQRPVWDDQYWIHGLAYDDGSILINPVIFVVDTLVHELLHHHNPKWSEDEVVEETNRILRALTRDEILLFYDFYGAATSGGATAGILQRLEMALVHATR